MTPDPNARETALDRPDPIEQARIALAVWSAEPPYGTALRDTTLARTAAVHLSNLLAELDALRAERDAALSRAVAAEDRYDRLAATVANVSTVKPARHWDGGAVSPEVDG